MERLKNLDVMNAEIIFRNFAGRATDFNDEGDRNFSVVIPDPEQAIAMQREGWNVQIRPRKAETRAAMKDAAHTFDERIEFLRSRNELDDAIFHLKVVVSYKYPEKAAVGLMKSNISDKPVKLDADTIYILDKADIVNVDLTINPSWWQRSGRSGYTSYLKDMVVTIQESELRAKYAEYYDNDEV
jgi:hypothetical protein